MAEDLFYWKGIYFIEIAEIRVWLGIYFIEKAKKTKVRLEIHFIKRSKQGTAGNLFH